MWHIRQSVKFAHAPSCGHPLLFQPSYVPSEHFFATLTVCNSSAGEFNNGFNEKVGEYVVLWCVCTTLLGGCQSLETSLAFYFMVVQGSLCPALVCQFNSLNLLPLSLRCSYYTDSTLQPTCFFCSVWFFLPLLKMSGFEEKDELESKQVCLLRTVTKLSSLPHALEWGMQESQSSKT